MVKFVTTKDHHSTTHYQHQKVQKKAQWEVGTSEAGTTAEASTPEADTTETLNSTSNLIQCGEFCYRLKTCLTV